MVDVKDTVLQRVCSDDLDSLLARSNKNSVIINLKYRIPLVKLAANLGAKLVLEFRTEDILNFCLFEVE